MLAGVMMFVKDTFAVLDRLLRSFFELPGTHLTVNECIKFITLYELSPAAHVLFICML